MKLINLSIFLSLVILGSLTGEGAFAQSKAEPERIMINPLEEGHRGVAITWRLPLDVDESFVQWGEAHPHPIRELDGFEQKQAAGRVDTVTYEEDQSTFKSFRVKITDLQPGEKYLYRVGSDSEDWSEWIQFEMPSGQADSAFTFIYFGDPQNDIHSQWSRVVRQAYATAPNASFFLYAGDLVNRGYNDEEWADWYRAVDFIHRMIPSIMTPGNHEYTDVVLSPLWRTHFTLPENGPQDVKALYGASYYIDYPAVRIISLDGEQIDEDPQMRLAQLKWLEEVLENTEQLWTIVTLHYPFFSTKPNRDNPKLRKAFKPVLDKYGVDLVLQGHDHGYGRGMIDENGPSDSGTMYVVSVSGPKMYDVGDEEWMQKRGEDTQLYQVITIEGNQLHYKSYTAIGELFDEFTLEKSSAGNVVE